MDISDFIFYHSNNNFKFLISKNYLDTKNKNFFDIMVGFENF